MVDLVESFGATMALELMVLAGRADSQRERLLLEAMPTSATLWFPRLLPLKNIGALLETTERHLGSPSEQSRRDSKPFVPDKRAAISAPDLAETTTDASLEVFVTSSVANLSDLDAS